MASLVMCFMVAHIWLATFGKGGFTNMIIVNESTISSLESLSAGPPQRPGCRTYPMRGGVHTISGYLHTKMDISQGFWRHTIAMGRNCGGKWTVNTLHPGCKLARENNDGWRMALKSYVGSSQHRSEKSCNYLPRTAVFRLPLQNVKWFPEISLSHTTLI